MTISAASRGTPTFAQGAARRWVPLVVFTATQSVAFAAFWLASHGAYSSFVARWDGEYYTRIAREGYPAHPAMDSSGQTSDGVWAFYPLYPLLVRLVAIATPLDVARAAPLVSVTAGALASVVLFRMVERHVSQPAAVATVVGVCTWMAAPVLQMAYTEAVALLLLALAFDLLLCHRYALLLPVLALLALSRPLTVPFAVVVSFHALRTWRDGAPARQRWWSLGTLAACPLLAVTWPAVAAVVTGRPNAYLEAMASFARPGAPRSWLAWWLHSGLIGWSVAGFVLALVAWLALRGIPAPCPAELRVWALSYPIYILAGTYISTSLVRYLLLTFPAAFVLSPMALPGRLRRGTLVILGAGGSALAVVWAQRFVGSSLYWIP